MSSERPVLYLGREGPPPPEHGGRLPVALATPFGPGPALSSLGWQAVYRLCAQDPSLAVERFHLSGAAPRSLESGRELVSFPVLALSASFEEDVLPLLEALGAASLPARGADREEFPLVLLGGPMAFLNPAPLAPIADLFFVGEAEAGLDRVLRAMAKAWLDGADKAGLLEAVAHMPGILIPGRTPTPVQRVIAPGPGLPEPAYSTFTGPEATFADTMLLEINRGCPYGCRFCAAGYVYRPPRQARMADLMALVEAVDPPKVGLVGTALTDWPDLLPFLTWLKTRNTKFSLASVRADGLTEELVAFLRQCGVRSVTLALEAPSDRLRQACAKKLDKEALLAAVERCSRLGVNHLKLYLIVGWPDENDRDYEELEAFLGRVARARDLAGKPKNPMRITLSVSSLVPKPHTPLQWAPMASEETLRAAIKRVKSMAKAHRAFKVDADNPAKARLQGLLARGGEELATLAELAAASGSWSRGLEAWDGTERAMAQTLDRTREEHEPFPWEVVEPGPGRAHLWKEWQRYLEGVGTASCPTSTTPDGDLVPGCASCGRCGIAQVTATE